MLNERLAGIAIIVTITFAILQSEWLEKLSDITFKVALFTYPRFFLAST
jgi:hypothetical protein